MAIEEIKEFWDDLTSGAEYDPEELYEPGAPRTDHWFKDYALPVGLNTLMAPFQSAKDMFIDAPAELLKGNIWEAEKQFMYPFMGMGEGYKDHYQFPFNPDLDPQVDLSGILGLDKAAIKMMDSGKPLISDLGMWMLSQSGGESDLSDVLQAPVNVAAGILNPLKLAQLATKGPPLVAKAAKQIYPYTWQLFGPKGKSASQLTMPWGPPPKGIMSKVKDFVLKDMWPDIRKSGEGFGQTVNRYVNPFNWKSYFRGDAPTAQRLIRNITLPQIYHGFTGDKDDGRSSGSGIDAMAAEYDPVFGDRDPVIFDNYMQERMDRIREPKPRIGIGFGDGPTHWGGGDIE